MLWEPTVQPHEPQEAFGLLLFVLAEWPASFYSKQSALPSPWGSLSVPWSLPAVIFEISPLLFERRELPPPPAVMNARWPRPVSVTFSSLASPDSCSPGKCLPLSFSGAGLCLCPQGIFLCELCSLALEQDFKVRIPGIESPG